MVAGGHYRPVAKRQLKVEGRAKGRGKIHEAFQAVSRRVAAVASPNGAAGRDRQCRPSPIACAAHHHSRIPAITGIREPPVNHRIVEDRPYAAWADTAKALASPRRVELLELLAQGERTVEALAREAGLTVSNSSSHLTVLKGTRLVETRKEAQSVFYRLADDAVVVLVREIQSLVRRRLHEVEHLAHTYFDGRAVRPARECRRQISLPRSARPRQPVFRQRDGDGLARAGPYPRAPRTRRHRPRVRRGAVAHLHGAYAHGG